MMETITMDINALIEKGIQNSYSYQEYRILVNKLVAEGKSTGHEQSEVFANYSMLNDRRMKRLDKTLKFDHMVNEAFSEVTTNVTWLVLTEGWCGDAAQSLPVINKLSLLNDGIDVRIISRDDHDELMSNFLTNGGKAIPKLIVFDNNRKEVLGSWGPRPSIAMQMVNNYKAEHGSLDPQFKEDLQGWYNKDKGKNIAEDLLKLL